MLGNFIYHNPTKIYFGVDALANLKEEIMGKYQRVLLAYGGGSIKRNGIYDLVISVLRKCKVEIVEFAGIMPNPTYEKVLEGAKLVREKQIDLILAVGGGSTIDCAKAVSLASYHDDAWNRFWVKHEPISQKLIPIASILTMAGTGSEMNGGTVITNTEAMLKKGTGYIELNPQFSILNPEFTYSVPKYQMLSGIFDIMSHIMETYFSADDGDNLSDDLAEAILKNVMRNTKVAIEDPYNYVARSNIMWDATMALNGTLDPGKDGDWEVHAIEHQIGAYYDVAHGMGLAAVSIAYYRQKIPFAVARFKKFAINVFNVDPDKKTDLAVANEGIDALADFIKKSEMCSSLRELGISDESKLKAIASSVSCYPTSYQTLTTDDVYKILKESF